MIGAEQPGHVQHAGPGHRLRHGHDARHREPVPPEARLPLPRLPPGVRSAGGGAPLLPWGQPPPCQPARSHAAADVHTRQRSVQRAIPRALHAGHHSHHGIRYYYNYY